MEKTLTKWFKFSMSLLSSLVAGLLFAVVPVITPATAAADSPINVWWPAAEARVSGVQPFKAMVPGLDVSAYEMFWQVDGGTWNWMDNSYADYPHKEARADVSTWHWQPSGTYTVTFIARRNGSVIGTSAVTIRVEGSSGPVAVAAPLLAASVASPTTVSSLSIATVPASSGNPFGNAAFYVDPNAMAARQADIWQNSDPAGAQLMRTLASASTAVWFGEWNANVTQDARNLVSRAQAAGSVPVIVAYAVPGRDCGGFSSGGTNNPNAYRDWIRKLASGIGSAKAAVVLEPDALAQIGCLSSGDQDTRLSLIAEAVSTLKQNPNTAVYIDAGHAGWVDAPTMAGRLNRANIAAADGFALNVSNFDATPDETTYGTALSAALSGKHFVIDTSRNGRGSNGQWCNPPGRAIGTLPTAATGNALIDAYLWLKVPGESDGYCNGGPAAGTWWADYARSLAANAP